MPGTTKKNQTLIEKVRSALSLLSIIRQETDTIGLAVSYGKDSLATIDLCRQVFTNLFGFYLFRVRDLDVVRQWRIDAQKKWNIQIIDYPHFDLSRCYKSSVLQPHWKDTEKAPRVDFVDVETKFRTDTGVTWISYGWRGNDSYSRILIMKKCRGIDFEARRVFPIRSFTRHDIYSYLDVQNIPRPNNLGRKEQGGLDFHKGAFESLSDQDKKKWLRDFPFSETVLV